MRSAEASPITPAVVYAAKSTEDRQDSIGTQLAEAREMAFGHGWTIIGEHTDEKFSAYTGNRGPGLAEAKAAAVAAAARYGTPCMLVAQAHDRFARGAGDAPGAPQSLGELWHELRRNNVQLRTVEDDEELRDEASVAAIGRRAYIDSRRKSKAVGKGMARRRAKGLHHGGPRKLGYDYTRDELGGTRGDRALRIVPAEADVVRRIFRDYAAGHSQRAIARTLTAEGVATARGGGWYQGTVAKILCDHFYAGLVRDGDRLVPGQHDAIIELELYRDAERIRSQGRRTLHVGGRPPTRPFLFTNGYLRCGRCGGAMIPRTGTQKRGPDGTPWGDRYERYICHTRTRDVTACEQLPVSRAAIEEAALSVLERRGVSVAQTRAQLLASIAAERARVEARLTDATRQERKAAEALARVRRDYMSGGLPLEDWTTMRPELEEELAGARAAREQVQHRLAELAEEHVDDALAAAVGEIREAIAAQLQDRGSIDEVRMLLRRIFASFVLRATRDELALVPELRDDALDELLDVTKRSTMRLTTAHVGLTT
jgi:site-specific DNA recombinase